MEDSHQHHPSCECMAERSYPPPSQLPLQAKGVASYLLAFYLATHLACSSHDPGTEREVEARRGNVVELLNTEIGAPPSPCGHCWLLLPPTHTPHILPHLTVEPANVQAIAPGVFLGPLAAGSDEQVWLCYRLSGLPSEGAHFLMLLAMLTACLYPRITHYGACSAPPEAQRQARSRL
jgi:hypothetical protein